MSEIRLKGAPICSGIAIGFPFLYKPIQESLPNFRVRTDEVQNEIDRFRGAIKESQKEVEKLRAQLESEGAFEGAAILESHLMMMQDPGLTSDIEARIRKTKHNTEHVFQKAITEYESKFEKIEDPLFRERIHDLQDVAHRVLRRLRSSVRISLVNAPDHAVVFAEQLTPSEAAEAGKIGAFVTRFGGDTSHSAIMARAKGIPYVARVDFREVVHLADQPVIVDGRTGEVILNPLPETLAQYRKLQEQLTTRVDRFKQIGSYAAETIDGYQISLSANLELANEVELVHQYGGDGIGLFRSEYLSLPKNAFPGEEEQFATYKWIAETLNGRPFVVRTFDIGGDKFSHLAGTKPEENPFLGCRAIRLMLREPEAFLAQLRAILRASVYGNVQILFPMVSGLPELVEAKQYVQQAKEQLRKEKIDFNDSIQIGCMIEVPSAAIIADALAKECDFFSIGTNDLVQYALAVDRDNQSMSYLYSPAHPSVIRLIHMVVEEAARHGLKVSVCGEMAADPHFTALLVGLGVRELSVASRHLPVIKQALRNCSVIKAFRLADEVLEMTDAPEVLDVLAKDYRANENLEPETT